jgi:hypothetical protein
MHEVLPTQKKYIVKNKKATVSDRERNTHTNRKREREKREREGKGGRGEKERKRDKSVSGRCFPLLLKKYKHNTIIKCQVEA